MRTRKLNAGVVRGLVFSPDGSTLAATTARFVWLWNPLTGDQPVRLPAGDFYGHHMSAAFSPDPRFIAALGSEGKVRVWSVGSDGPEYTAGLRTRWWASSVFAISPSGHRLVACGRRSMAWWNNPTRPATKARLPSGNHTRSRDGSSPTAMCFTPDGSRLLVGAEALELWAADMSGEVEAIPTRGQGRIRALSVSPDGLRVAMVLENGAGICHFGRRDWEPLPVPAERLTCAVFMPDGRSLLAAGADGFVHCIDLQAAQETRRFDWRIGRVRAVAVSSDGLTCAAGGENGQVVVWDVDT